VNYTATAVIGVVLAVAYDVFGARTRLVTRRSFWTAYAIVLGFQLVVNGLLTGLRIVRYDPRRIIGWRIAYAPVEDLLFGFAMVLVTLTTWVWLGRRGASTTPSPDRLRRPSRGAAGPP
jgi:lycopene cyclase domain-containing protein